MELFFIHKINLIYESILISIIEIDCGEMVSHIGISIGTDMIFGGIATELSIQLLESLEQWMVWIW